MKYFRLALLGFVSVFTLARGQEEKSQQPPTEIPDFSNLDEYVYESRTKLIVGFRVLKGAKAQFYGRSTLAAPETATDATTPNILRAYHDGTVSPDARTAGRSDSGGNPALDPSNGSADTIASDGKTNSWSYTDPKQINADGSLAFHTYSANVIDPLFHHKDAPISAGLDVAMSREMGKLFGSRVTWSIVAGVTLNDVTADTTAKVQASLTTITDIYSLDGQTLPAAPYSSPSSSTATVLDTAGNAVLNSDGTTQTASTDTSILLNNKPVTRTTQTAVDSTSVSTRWKLRGANYTFRAGPALWVPFTDRLRASLSVGPALVYSGTDYTVIQRYQPDTGAEINNTSSDYTSHVLPGYFADASLLFDLTDRTGFFAGAVFQSAGSYTQTLNTVSATNSATVDHYSTKIDFSNQAGLRAGMTIRF